MLYKVLIVDDSEGARSQVEWLMMNEGFHVIAHHDGSETVKMVKKFRPDLLILDINMPGISTADLCREIRDLPEYALMPIIVLGGTYSTEMIMQTVEAGATDFAAKPIDNQTLVEVVHEHIRLIELRKRDAGKN